MAWPTQSAFILFGLPLVMGTPPVFDYIFSANCPLCRWYGNNTLKKVFNADGVADAVQWNFNSAVRKDENGKYQCVEEDPGCPITRYYLCASRLDSPKAYMTFMTCFNEHEIIKPGQTEALSVRAKACASAGNLDIGLIEQCHGSDLGESLMKVAEERFTTRFPEYSKPGHGPFGVPRAWINGDQVGDGAWARLVSVDDHLKLLCEKGMQAPVCKQEALKVGTNPTHYGDPKTGCESDEQSVQVQGVSGDFCSPKCKNQVCPTDVPSGVTAKPQCALQTPTGTAYCALICTPSELRFNGANGECGAASCQAIQGTGLCTYPTSKPSTILVMPAQETQLMI